MKRFYQKAESRALETGYAVFLDDKMLRSPLRTEMTGLPSQLAAAIAAEWAAVDEVIDLSQMPLTQFAYAVFDRVKPARAERLCEIDAYTAHDPLFFWAVDPPELCAQQKEIWQPQLDWAMKRLSVVLHPVTGLAAIGPAAHRDMIQKIVAGFDDFHLTVFYLAVQNTSSLLTSLAFVEGQINGQDAAKIAHLHEYFQMTRWGRDDELETRLHNLQKDLEDLDVFLGLLSESRA